MWPESNIMEHIRTPLTECNTEPHGPVYRERRPQSNGMNMRHRSKQFAWVGIVIAMAFAAVVEAKPETVFQSVTPRALPSVLTPPRSESPAPLDPDAAAEPCAVCRLASRTAEELTGGTFQLQPEVVENGALLRLISEDPQVRDALWRVTLERGALLASLRAGDEVQLCGSCAIRRAQLQSLDISARRIPEGVLLVYTSASPLVVRQIHALVRTGIAASAPF